MNQKSNKGQFSFSKDERITNKKVIQKLFESGKKVSLSPFIVKYIFEKKEIKNKILISVSKSKINNELNELYNKIGALLKALEKAEEL